MLSINGPYCALDMMTLPFLKFLTPHLDAHVVELFHLFYVVYELL